MLPDAKKFAARKLFQAGRLVRRDAARRADRGFNVESTHLPILCMRSDPDLIRIFAGNQHVVDSVRHDDPTPVEVSAGPPPHSTRARGARTPARASSRELGRSRSSSVHTSRRSAYRRVGPRRSPPRWWLPRRCARRRRHPCRAARPARPFAGARPLAPPASARRALAAPSPPAPPPSLPGAPPRASPCWRRLGRRAMRPARLAPLRSARRRRRRPTAPTPLPRTR